MIYTDVTISLTAVVLGSAVGNSNRVSSAVGDSGCGGSVVGRAELGIGDGARTTDGVATRAWTNEITNVIQKRAPNTNSH